MLHRTMGPVAAGLAVALAGCASVTGGDSQRVHVQAQTTEGAAVDTAECTLTNDRGSWVVRTPGEVIVHRSNHSMEVRCRRAALPEGVVIVESGTRAAVYGNILVGGVIGAVIDHNTGAAYEYPERVRVVMGRTTNFTLPRPGGTPSASGYAELKDLDALPPMAAKGRETYTEWLNRPHPRAFAIGPNGGFGAAWTGRSNDPSLSNAPNERALTLCERRAHATCRLYAVNDQVVWEAEGPAPKAGTAAAPATPPATAAATSPGTPRPQPSFIATGYAAIEDVDAMPWLSDRGRTAYREWLTRPTPRAFAIGTNGYWWSAYGLRSSDPTLPSDPTERALAGCTRAGGTGCRLYAVNGSVVFTKP